MKNYLNKIFIVLLFCIPLNAKAQQIALRIPDTTAVQYSEFNVPVYVDSSLTGKNVLSYQLQITFYSSYLEFKSIQTEGTLSESASFSVDASSQSEGTLNIAGASANALSGTGVLIYIRFKAIKNGTANINFTDTANNLFNEGGLELTFDNGKVTISIAPYITVSPNSETITVGDELQFSVSGGEEPYTWHVTNSESATIDDSGLLTATKIGVTRVYAIDNAGVVDTTNGQIEIRGLKLTIPDTTEYPNTEFYMPVYTTDVTGLGIISGKITLEYDETDLTAIDVKNENTILSAYSKPEYTVSDGEITIAFAGSTPISGSGVLLYVQFKTAKKNSGYTNITPTDILFNQDILANSDYGYFTIRSLEDLEILPESGIIYSGETLQFSGSGGKTPYLYATTDTFVATIDSNGLLTAKNGGTVEVILTDAIESSVTSSNIEVYDLKVSVNDTSALIGDTLVLPVYVDRIPAGKPIVSFEMQLNYSRSFFEPVGITTTGSLTESWSAAFDTDTGNSVINAAGAYSSSLSDGNVLLYVLLHILPDVEVGQTSDISFGSLTLNEGFPRPLLAGGTITAKTTVLPESAPEVITIIPAADTTVTEGDLIEFFVRAVDADDNSLYVTWYVNEITIKTDTTTDSTSTAIIQIPFDYSGEFIVRASVSDGVLTADTTWNITIEEITSSTDIPVTVTLSSDTSSLTVNFTNNSSLSFNFTSGDVSGKTLSATQVSDITGHSSGAPDFENEAYYYDISLDVDNFDATLIFGYSDAVLAGTGISEDSLIVSYYDSTDSRGYIWHVLPSTIDKVNNTITVTTNHFSLWAVVSKEEQLTTSVTDPERQIPVEFSLFQNYPNPFNPETLIMYQLPKVSKVILKVFDVLGMEVCTLVNEKMPAGRQSVIWDGRNKNGLRVSSGVYIYKFQAGYFLASKKMVLLK